MKNLQIEVFDEDVHDDDDTMGRATVRCVCMRLWSCRVRKCVFVYVFAKPLRVLSCSSTQNISLTPSLPPSLPPSPSLPSSLFFSDFHRGSVVNSALVIRVVIQIINMDNTNYIRIVLLMLK